MKTFADKIISFNKKIAFNGVLPEGISIMNPFKENKEAVTISTKFYKKYYDDHDRRHIILGINPGRFGAGVTGVPFTDTKRLFNECGLEFTGEATHEPSATFVYEVINAYGGPKAFYKDFYIQSICPLGFTLKNDKGREVNYNYYDSKELTEAIYDFMIANIRKQIKLGIQTDICFCFGTGKNVAFLKKINEKYKFFKTIIPLEHPRFIMQYRFKSKQVFLDKYIKAFEEIKSKSIDSK
ncbi:MAG: uracil-DNA glycosylase family protein [Ginsengibacter sp.]